MKRGIQRCANVTALVLGASCSAQQPVPSQPISEYTFKAGEAFKITVPLFEPSSVDLEAGVSYMIETGSNESFGCFGNIRANAQTLELTCQTNPSMSGGEYRAVGPISGSRQVRDKTESFAVPSRLPIVTAIANPPPPPDPPVRPPKAGNGQLALDKTQALHDGEYKITSILSSLNAHFPTDAKDTKENRAYLVGQARIAKGVIEITRQRYSANEPAKTPSPIFLDDFDRRLDRIIRELGGTPNQKTFWQQTTVPRLVLVQMPRTSDSVDARAGAGTLNKKSNEFVAILEDMLHAFEKIGDSGATSFSWSITTTPTGAEVYYSRLGEPEMKWAGLSNVKDAKIEYAIWTFRIDWNGCSKKETPNPYFQSPVPMVVNIAGCTKK